MKKKKKNQIHYCIYSELLQINTGTISSYQGPALP